MESAVTASWKARCEPGAGAKIFMPFVWRGEPHEPSPFCFVFRKAVPLSMEVAMAFCSGKTFSGNGRIFSGSAKFRETEQSATDETRKTFLMEISSIYQTTSACLRRFISWVSRQGFPDLSSGLPRSLSCHPIPFRPSLFFSMAFYLL